MVTSNLDGQFQTAGFGIDGTYEVHGSIHYLQCTVPCSAKIRGNEIEISVDESTMMARNSYGTVLIVEGWYGQIF